MENKSEWLTSNLLLGFLIKLYKIEKTTKISKFNRRINVSLFLIIVYLLSLKQERNKQKIALKINQIKHKNEQTFLSINQLFIQGNQQLISRKFKEALKSFQQTLKAYRKINNQEGEAYSLAAIGNVYQAQRQFRKAIEYLQKSLNISLDTARDITNANRWKASCLGDLGFCYCAIENYKDAVIYLENSLHTALEFGNYEWEVARLVCLSEMYGYIKQNPKNIHYLYECATFTKKIGSYREGEEIVTVLAMLYINLGFLYHHIGDFEKEIECSFQSLEFLELTYDPKLKLGSLGNLGNAYNYLGKYQLAIDYLNKALMIAREIFDDEGEAKTLSNLGDVYTNIGQYNEAINYHQKSLEIERKLKNREGEAQSLRSLGAVYFSQGQYKKSINKHNQCLAIALEIKDDQLEADSLCNLGNTYSRLGDYQQAIDKYKKYEEIVIKIHDKRGLANALGNLGDVYQKMNRLELAIEHLQRSIAITVDMKERQLEGIFLSCLSIAIFKTGKFEESEIILNKAIYIFEELIFGLKRDTDIIAISDKLIYSYGHLQLVLVAQNKTDEALEFSEKVRARIFSTSLAKRLAVKPLKLIQKSHLEIIIEKPIVQEIKRIAKEYSYHIVEYSIISYDMLLYIWVVNPNGIISFRSVNLEPLQEDFNSLKQMAIDARQRIDDDLWRDNQLILQELYKYLILPIIDLLPTDPNEPIVFIPQYELFLVPFAALRNVNNKFLIEQHTICIAPSIVSFKLIHQQKDRIKNNRLKLEEKISNILVVGNPIMPVDPESETKKVFDSLPYAEEEAKEIANLFKAKAFIGNKATKVDIVQQMPKANIIHIATHGIDKDIYQSGIPGAIALAPSDNDSGFLTSSEILDLNLNAELIILSACNTGMGKITSDGIIGLSRCFLLAGTPSVIVSLWRIGDNSTKFLMTKFYQNFLNGIGKAQALRLAMLATMQEYPNNPKAWAAFILIGESD